MPPLSLKNSDWTNLLFDTNTFLPFSIQTECIGMKTVSYNLGYKNCNLILQYKILHGSHNRNGKLCPQ